MSFLLTVIGIIFLIEIFIKIYRPAFANDAKKMKVIRSIIMAVFSPFIAVGMILGYGEEISENLGFVFILTFVFLGLALLDLLTYKKDHQ